MTLLPFGLHVSGSANRKYVTGNARSLLSEIASRVEMLPGAFVVLPLATKFFCSVPWGRGGPSLRWVHTVPELAAPVGDWESW